MPNDEPFRTKPHSDTTPPGGDPGIPEERAPGETVAFVPEGTLEPERLRAIRHRVTAGFYDGTDARDIIARRVRADLL